MPYYICHAKKFALSGSLTAFAIVSLYVSFRFDVSGVHPKSKYPGTFTEIPYDKKSIDELVNTLTDYTS